MGLPAEKLTQEIENSASSNVLHSDETNVELKDLIGKTHSEELIITLCGYIGTDIHGVSEMLKQILETTFNYTVEIIKLSTFIKQHSSIAKEIKAGFTKYEYTKKLIEGGNELRQSYDNSILAQLAYRK